MSEFLEAHPMGIKYANDEKGPRSFIEYDPLDSETGISTKKLQILLNHIREVRRFRSFRRSWELSMRVSLSGFRKS